MHQVRRHIVEILKERNGATVAELADLLDMAPVSVRHHLDILQGDNLIRVERTARSGAVGRPQQVYALTDEADELFPNNFAALAGTLVHQVKQVLPPEQVESIFRAMAHDLAQEFLAQEAGVPLASLSPEERVRRVAEFLNARGYLASYEPDDEAGSFLVHKHNCPYSGVSGQHDELCLMDQALVDSLFGRRCERITHMVSDGHCCTYRVRADATPADGTQAPGTQAGGCACNPTGAPQRSTITLVSSTA